MRRELSPRVAEILADFSRRLKDRFGDRLRQLTLFGSQARGEAREDSDIDVAVVLDRIDSHDERTWPMAVTGDLCVQYGLVITPIVLSVAELEFLA
jgi:uncharacterized protein